MRVLRVLLIRVLPIVLMLEFGLRIEWVVRERLAETTPREAEVHLLAFGNSLVAGYPPFLRATIEQRLPHVDAMVEELVIGKRPSDQLIDALQVRLREGPVDVVIALIGAYDRKASRNLPRDPKPPESNAVGEEKQSASDILLSRKPMLVGVVRAALQSWREELTQGGLRGLFRPDERTRDPVFSSGSDTPKIEPTRSQQRSSTPAVPLAIGWRAKEESRRIVASGDMEAVAAGFTRIVSIGWEADYTSNAFQSVKHWYRSISRQSAGFIEELLALVPNGDMTTARSALEFAYSFRRGDYERALQLGSMLPDHWFRALSVVHAQLASPEDFERFLKASVRSRGADAHAVEMEIRHRVSQDPSNEVIPFLADLAAGRGFDANLTAKDRAMLELLARRQLARLLVDRADCMRATRLGLSSRTAALVEQECHEKRDEMDPEINLYTDVSRKSYRRLISLSRKHGFAVVAVHYPGRRVDDLLSILPGDADVPVVDNHERFVAAVEEHGYLGVYDKLRGFHLTPLGDELLAENIFNALIAEGLLPNGLID